jgi:hypothetical protein
VITILLISFAAFCKALADTLAHHFDTSVFRKKNRKFWDPVISSEWVKKVFAYKLDAWHLSNSAMIVAMVCAIVFHSNRFEWWIEIPIGGVVWNLVFNLFYNKILR